VVEIGSEGENAKDASAVSLESAQNKFTNKISDIQASSEPSLLLVLANRMGFFQETANKLDDPFRRATTVFSPNLVSR